MDFLHRNRIAHRKYPYPLLLLLTIPKTKRELHVLNQSIVMLSSPHLLLLLGDLRCCNILVIRIDEIPSSLLTNLTRPFLSPYLSINQQVDLGSNSQSIRYSDCLSQLEHRFIYVPHFYKSISRLWDI